MIITYNNYNNLIPFSVGQMLDHKNEIQHSRLVPEVGIDNKR